EPIQPLDNLIFRAWDRRNRTCHGFRFLRLGTQLFICPRVIVYSPEVSWKRSATDFLRTELSLQKHLPEDVCTRRDDCPILAPSCWESTGTVSRGSTLLL